MSELKSELARKYYSEDQNCLSDFIDILDEYETELQAEKKHYRDALEDIKSGGYSSIMSKVATPRQIATEALKASEGK